MHTPNRFASLWIFALALILASSGCSPAAKRERQLKIADQHFTEGKYDEAEVEYLNVLKSEALNARAIGRLGLIYAAQGRVGPAVNYVRKGHELLPDDLELRYRLGQLSFATGNLKDAQEQAFYILDHRPLDPDAPVLAATAVGSQADVETVTKKLKGLPAPAPTGAPVLTALALLEVRLSHVKAAEALCQQALQVDPASPEAHTAMGIVQMINKDVAGATASFRRAAELSPPRSPRCLHYAEFLLRNGKIDDGKKIIAEITEKTPDFLPAWIAAAGIVLSERKFAECDAILEKALSRDAYSLDALLMRGRLRLAEGRTADALKEMEKLSTTFPMVPAVLFELARAQVANGDNGSAIANLNQVVNRAPNNADAVLLLASLDLRKGDLSAAVVLLRKLVQQRPDLLQGRLLLADAYRAQGNMEDALAIYRQLEDQFPKNPQTPLLRGLVLVQQKNYAEARKALERAHELVPDEPIPLEQLVNLDLLEAKPQAARERVTAEITRNPKLNAMGQLLLAKVSLAEKDFGAAETALKKCIAAAPDNQTAYVLLAGIYNRSNQLDKALAQLQQAVARNAKDASTLLLIGVLQDQQKDYVAARATYEKVLEINPRSVAVLNNLAYLQSERFGQLDKALELAQRARDLNPKEPHLADTLGWILFQRKQFPRALTLLQEAAELMPSSPEVQYHLGITHYMMGEEDAARLALQRSLQPGADFAGIDEAREALDILAIDSSRATPEIRTKLERIVAERKGDPIALMRLADIEKAQGRLEQAARSLEAALQINDKNVYALVSLTRIYALQKEPAKALERAKIARKLAPDDAAIAHTLGRLAYEMGDFAWAASLLQESARKQASPELQYDLGRALYSVGRVDDAVAALHAALQPAADGTVRLFTQSDPARHMLELIQLADHPAEAQAQQAQIEQTLKNDPENVPAAMLAGILMERRGDLKGARQLFDGVLGRFPDFLPAKVRLAAIAAKSGAFEQRAFDFALQVRSAQPSNPEIARSLGILTALKGEYPRAITLLKESSARFPDDAELLYYVGFCQARTKDSSAQKTLQRALDIGLPEEIAANARKLLAELK